MSKSPFGKGGVKHKVLSCPRDKTVLDQQEQGEATLDVCSKCGGQFFDSGEMFAAFGIKADPTYWDRPETGGPTRTGDVPCPRCEAHLLTQEIRHEGQAVEIDRCGKCGGLWLDAGEATRIIAIGEKMAPVIAAEKAQAQKELDALGDDAFGSPGLIARFLGLFQKKS